MKIPVSEEDLLLSSYDYELLDERIAKRPLTVRDNSKLLVYDARSNEVIHTNFFNLANYLPQNANLVLNQTKVFSCRLFGKKSTGGKCEVFILTLVDRDGAYNSLVKTTGKKRVGDEYRFDDGITAVITSSCKDGTFYLKFNRDIETVIKLLGNVPIPPYVRDGVSDELDRESYQTVFAKNSGSVAAPTAGFHFTPELFEKLRVRGVQKSFVTLHVGLGTFSPVKCEKIIDHNMHSESYHVDARNLDIINNGGPRFAVGTTTLRVLESSLNGGGEIELDENKIYNTDIFLYPGKQVKSISGLITNFHLPKSSLLMLVSSLIGRKKTLELYQEAIEHEYRFYSYGDGMLILL